MHIGTGIKHCKLRMSYKTKSSIFVLSSLFISQYITYNVLSLHKRASSPWQRHQWRRRWWQSGPMWVDTWHTPTVSAAAATCWLIKKSLPRNQQQQQQHLPDDQTHTIHLTATRGRHCKFHWFDWLKHDHVTKDWLAETWSCDQN